jgi:uncharacterized protein
VDAAVAYLRTRPEIDKNKIGLAGHSEGGLIAPMVAAGNKNVAFIVLLAGTGIPGDQLLLLQQRLIGKATGETEEDLQKAGSINKGAFELVKRIDNLELLKKELSGYLKEAHTKNPDAEKPAGMSDEDLVNSEIKQLTTPWMHYFIKYNPAPALEKVKCPVLAINGEKDLQVPPKENLEAIRKALTKGKNKNITIKEIPGLNHLFQESLTGAPAEYATIEQTFSPGAMKLVADWIHQQTN